MKSNSPNYWGGHRHWSPPQPRYWGGRVPSVPQGLTPLIISHPEILCRGPRFHPEMYLGVRDNYVWVRNTMSDPEIIKKIFPDVPSGLPQCCHCNCCFTLHHIDQSAVAPHFALSNCVVEYRYAYGQAYCPTNIENCCILFKGQQHSSEIIVRPMLCMDRI